MISGNDSSYYTNYIGVLSKYLKRNRAKIEVCNERIM